MRRLPRAACPTSGSTSLRADAAPATPSATATGSGRHTGEIRPDPVAVADGVAGAASALKEVLPLVGHAARGNLRIALHRETARPPKEIADRRGQKLGVVDGGVAHPLAARLVADHEAGAVPVSRQRVAAARQPQLLGDEFDVVLLAGKKQP